MAMEMPWGKRILRNTDHIRERCDRHDVWLQKQFNMLCRDCPTDSPSGSTRCRKCGSRNLMRDPKSWFDIIAENRGTKEHDPS